MAEGGRTCVAGVELLETLQHIRRCHIAIANHAHGVVCIDR